jgi:hypothetical protein
MAKRRFIAPARSELAPATFVHPAFDGVSAFQDWLISPDWPTLECLNDAMPRPDMRFVLQDQALLNDGLHYEARIAECGAIATRDANWHDLFNAMIWCAYPEIKRALNARQMTHIATMGPSQRSRAQYALTQFDEAGVIVQVRDANLVDAWNRHDWTALFHRHASAWHHGGIRIAAVIGHALLEHALVPELLLVGKCVVVQGDIDDEACVAKVARAIAEGRVLNDPQELRPLPLAGVPGWYPGQDAVFFAEAECFQPVRAGRVYPQPL